MIIKAGVDISRLKPEIRKTLKGIASIVWRCTGLELVITSTYEGTHGENSLHYANLAIDIRNKPIDCDTEAEIKKWLGKDYDVIQERTHLHIEYDPK